MYSVKVHQADNRDVAGAAFPGDVESGFSRRNDRALADDVFPGSSVNKQQEGLMVVDCPDSGDANRGRKWTAIPK